MCTVLPEICDPDLDTELVTITPMKSGSGPAGGFGPLPGPVGPLTVPGEVVPSPQSIVAVKSLTGANGLASVNVATFPLNDFVETVGVAQLAESGASAMIATPFAVAWFEELTLSVIVTLTGFDPSSVYVCVPLTVNGPPVGPLTVPEVTEPSPQSIEALYWAAGAEASGSVKVATGPLNDAPSVVLIVFPVAVICP